MDPQAIEKFKLRERWASVAACTEVLKICDMRTIEPMEPDPGGRWLKSLVRDIGYAFPCRETMASFYAEVCNLDWTTGPKESPWEDFLAMGCDIATHGSLLPEYPSGRTSPVLLKVREMVDALHASRASRGFVYVFQQETEEGIWTSTPMWAEDMVDVVRGVHAGWLSGRRRWAASFSGDGSEPSFLAGVSREGLTLKGSAVESIIRATVRPIEIPAARKPAGVDAPAERPRA